MLAESLWMSNKSKKELYPDFKPKINKLREFFIQTLITDHKRQWDEYKNQLTSEKTTSLNDNN